MKKQLEDTIGDRDRELLLQQQLAALQQKEVLLMQQQAGAAGSHRSWQPTSTAAYQASLQQPWRAAFPSCQQCYCMHPQHATVLSLHYITLSITLHYITKRPLFGVLSCCKLFCFILCRVPWPCVLLACTLHGSHPASSLVPTAAAGQSCMCLQGGQTCMACHCVWSSRQNPCPSSPAY